MGCQKVPPKVHDPSYNLLPAPGRTLLCLAVPTAARVGLSTASVVLIGSDRRVPPGFAPEQAAILEGLTVQTKSFVAGTGCDPWEQSAVQAHAAGSLGDRPLIVLTAGKPFAVGDPKDDKELAAFQDIWIHRLQTTTGEPFNPRRQLIG